MVEGLTKQSALELTKELWEFMRDNKFKTSLDKGKWPRWRFNGGDIPSMNYDCPCCEYGTYQKEKEEGYWVCEYCPLVGYAWSITCLENNSPYCSFSEDKGTPSDAQKIIDACDRALLDMHEGK